MICKNCGSHIENTDVKCPSCYVPVNRDNYYTNYIFKIDPDVDHSEKPKEAPPPGALPLVLINMFLCFLSLFIIPLIIGGINIILGLFIRKINKPKGDTCLFGAIGCMLMGVIITSCLSVILQK